MVCGSFTHSLLSCGWTKSAKHILYWFKPEFSCFTHPGCQLQCKCVSGREGRSSKYPLIHSRIVRKMDWGIHSFPAELAGSQFSESVPFIQGSLDFPSKSCNLLVASTEIATLLEPPKREIKEPRSCCEILHHVRHSGMMTPCKHQQPMGFPWFQSGRFRPPKTC